jgi:hypothetical protein
MKQRIAHKPRGSRLAAVRPKHSRFDGAAQKHNNDQSFNFRDPADQREAISIIGGTLADLDRAALQRQAERQQSMVDALELKRRRTRLISG